MTEEPVDARQLRTRAALHAAVLELAASGDIDGVTVTALAERAGVHRSTVYEHGGSPQGVLQRALAVELDALREAHLRDVAPAGVAAALREVTLGVFAHVERHAAVYRNLEGSVGTTLHSFLSEHFQASTRLLIAQSRLRIPLDEPDVAPALLEEAAARFVADGVVGLISVWLRGPGLHDPEVALAMLERLLPAWWPPGAATAGDAAGPAAPDPGPNPLK
ncbi:TetR/AcrR family transcriptional regulator [Leucobacter allii]|uniref:TetR/AcrR family transcriptional regulator n=1 Tax=Leucobacter allii TaxID=2932247 RepID=A0ABY4FHR9_9MICO|nr:TetR/AcrR family transcriptional regulator [Leucobacter allii]UOQ56194.1 TetR/AcrR family transcriptional regulator [Leucobacter allii]